MWEFNKIKSSKNLQIVSILIVSAGIFFRFYHQFIEWTFNSDEVLLGLDILNHNYSSLLKPFKSFQSAPPLFLILQKLISELPPSYISLKILSFVSSSFAVIYFKKLIERSKISVVSLCLLLIFTFHPFILYHSLALKQYTFDLTFGILAVYYFEKRRSFLKIYLFFTLWCLLSNAALFFTTAFICHIFIKNLQVDNIKTITYSMGKSYKESFPFILAPIVYIGFFIWFMSQPGAEEAKSFMTTYWEIWFLPLNDNIFWWIGVQFYRMMFFFYSTYLFLGLIFLLGFLYGCFWVWKRREKENLFLVKIYFLTIGVHLILSSLRLYPFSDRLYLYMAPLVLYLAFYGLVRVFTSLKLKKKYIRLFMLLSTFLLLGFNSTYIPYKENNVPALNRELSLYDNHKIFRTSRANNHINQWVEFTNYPGLSSSFIDSESRTSLDSVKRCDLIISRIHRKFGHKMRTNKIEDSLKMFLDRRKTKKVISVNGYIVYLILD